MALSGGYSNLGARGKNFQKLMSEKKRALILACIFFSVTYGVLYKKKSLHFDFISDFPFPKIRVFSNKKKKKRSSLPFALSLPYFHPKIRVFSKKKKVFTQNCSSHSEQTSATETVCVIFERDP